MVGPSSPPVEFAVTPRFDVFYALYALSSNASSVVDAWKSKARERLPQNAEQAATRIAPLPIFWPLLADSIQSVPGEISFDDILSTISEIPADDLQSAILAGIFHDVRIVDSLVAGRRTLKHVLTDDKVVGTELLGHFGLRPYSERSAPVKAIASLLTKTESFRDELVTALRRFWETGFESDWSALEPILRDEAARMSALRDDASLPELAIELNLPVTFDDKAKEVRPRSGPPISYDQIDRCYVIPSAFNTRRWWAKYANKRGRFTLYLPVVRVPEIANLIEAHAAQLAEPPQVARHEINAESVFRALGDTTRYAIASILARTPTSSADLARSLNVSKPTITHHVHALRAAGLLTETPSAGSTKLSLRVDTVAGLSRAAIDQLFSSTGDLALSTTRKRRGG
jgi:DNA-binding transcriptional ArsR family regulator